MYTWMDQRPSFKENEKVTRKQTWKVNPNAAMCSQNLDEMEGRPAWFAGWRVIRTGNDQKYDPGAFETLLVRCHVVAQALLPDHKLLREVRQLSLNGRERRALDARFGRADGFEPDAKTLQLVLGPSSLTNHGPSGRIHDPTSQAQLCALRLRVLPKEDALRRVRGVRL